MADRNGYIGRSPGDAQVTIARQTYTPGGIQTDFTFDSGYTVGYLDAFINGVRQIEATDYVASDGANVGFTSYLISGDTLELVAYKAFNVNDVSSTPGNFTVGNDLTVDGSVSISGITTLGAGSSVSWATTAFNLSGTPNIGVNDINAAGVITAVTGNFSGNVTIGGSLIYDDVTNVDSFGIGTFRTGINVGPPTGVGITLGTSGTGDAIYAGVITATTFSGDFSGNLTGNATGLTGQPSIDVEAIVVNSGIVTVTTFDGNLSGDVDAPAFDTNIAGVVVTGVCTATTFKGDGAGLSGVGGENDITSCLFI